MSQLVMIVEDEVDLATTLEYNLRQAGYDVRVAHTGRSALALVAQHPLPDLVVLDLMLPDLTGVQVCRRIRDDEALGNIPVVMCTAKGEEIDRVVGLEVGADDYVVKPYSMRELLLRIRAVLRRLQRPEESVTARTFGKLKIDHESHRAWVDASEITLTAIEFRLLDVFIARAGRVQTREALLEDVWGLDRDTTTRTVDTHVKRLREKLGDLAGYIETVRGVGYRFIDDEALAEPQMEVAL
jgi:two-component system phosphate regulon response regulator PhoB